jgi:hypothetical protein
MPQGASDTATITVRTSHRGAVMEVQGQPICDGLAITPHLDKDRDNRFAVTHTASGLALIQGQCRTHIDRAAEVIQAATGIDWTAEDRPALVEQIKATALMVDIRAVLGAQGCPKWKADCSEPDQPGWDVRCHTCGWQWEDDNEEGPMDAKRARDLADDHECEPEVQVCPPGETRWMPPHYINRDGTWRVEPKHN